MMRNHTIYTIHDIDNSHAAYQRLLRRYCPCATISERYACAGGARAALKMICQARYADATRRAMIVAGGAATLLMLQQRRF